MTTIKANSLFQAGFLSVMERVGSDEITLVYLHPPWLLPREFLWKVFLQCRRILKDQGSVFLHSLPRLAGIHRSMLDQAFGAERFVSEFVWTYQYSIPRFDTKPKLRHEVIWVYSKSDHFVFNEIYKPLTTHIVANLLSFQDEHGPYELVDLTAPLVRSTMQFEWRGILPPPNRSWRYTLERLEQMDSEGRIHWDDNKPRQKRYLDEMPSLLIDSVWDDIPLRTDNKAQAKKVHPTGTPLALVERIVKLASNPGDIVLDPFCGSGTTLMAAQSNNRRWIGCDDHPFAIDFTVQTLQQLGVFPEVHFEKGNQNLVETQWQPVPFYYRPLIMPSDISTCPLILTEGKTDWKHLKAAFSKLRTLGLYQDFEIEFHEYEDDMGDGELVGLCRQLSKIRNFRKVICVFDRDKPEIISKVSSSDGTYKSWGNNVFSFAIPVPLHRSEANGGICLELYYQDSEIMRADKEGRRLFLSTEFHRSGRHRAKRSIVCSNISRVRSSKLAIIDGEVYNSREENIALPKSGFAEYVLARESNFNDFDVSEFCRIFDVIIEISMT